VCGGTTVPSRLNALRVLKGALEIRGGGSGEKEGGAAGGSTFTRAESEAVVKALLPRWGGAC